jgi:urease accessory protein UreH
VLQTANIDQPALQRARGAVDLVVKAGKLERFYQSGSAKIFLPKTYAQTIEAVLVNTAGGLTGGDEFGGQAWRRRDTHLTVSTQTRRTGLSRIRLTKCRNACQYDSDRLPPSPLAAAGNNLV